MYFHSNNINLLKMEIEHKYTFVPLVQKNLININDKKIQEFLTKW